MVQRFAGPLGIKSQRLEEQAIQLSQAIPHSSQPIIPSTRPGKRLQKTDGKITMLSMGKSRKYLLVMFNGELLNYQRVIMLELQYILKPSNQIVR